MNKEPFFKKPESSESSTSSTPGNTGTSTTAAQERRTAKTAAKSPAEQLLELATAGIHFFLSNLNEPHCSVTIDGHKETFRVNSTEFRQYLRILYHEKTAKQISRQAMEEVIEMLGAKSRFKGHVEPLFIRVAGHGSKIFIDTCDRNRDVIEIGADGWAITKNPPVHFIRKRSMDALPLPERGGNISSLRPFLNLRSNSDFILFVSWLVRSMSPEGPYPVLTVMGDSGSAKSSLVLVARLLIDPSVSPNRSAPRNERDLFIAAANGWCVSFDNLSHCPEWLSNVLCLMATGGGYSTRKLYSDEEESVFKVKRPIIISGIKNLATETDLITRAIILVLPEIEEPVRIAEDIFYDEFLKQRPFILGALCDTVGVILRDIGSVRTDRLPRMADFARWMLAAEPVLPPSDRSVLDIYLDNQNYLANMALDEDPVTQAVISLMQNRSEWKGTASETLLMLEKQPGVNAAIKYSPNWPKAANKLRQYLKRAESYLLKNGIQIEFDLMVNMGIRILRFKNLGQQSVPSPYAEPASLYEIVETIEIESLEAGFLQETTEGTASGCETETLSMTCSDNKSLETEDEEEEETYKSIF